MQQIADQAELSNFVVPLNQETIFRVSDLADRYQLRFKAVPWLPDLTIQAWEYDGILPDSNDEDGFEAGHTEDDSLDGGDF